MTDFGPSGADAPGGVEGACRACAAPLASDQRYCLSCGELVAGRRMDPLAAVRGELGDEPRPAVGKSAPAPAAGGAAGGAAALGSVLARRVSPVPLTVATIMVIAAGGGAIASGSSSARPVAAAAPVAAAPTTTAATTATTPADTSTSDDSSASSATPAASTPDAAAPVDDSAAAAPVAAAPEAAAPAPTAPTASGDAAPAPTEDAPLGPDDLKVDHVWVVGLQDPDAAKTLADLAGGSVTLNKATASSSSPTADAMALVAGVKPGPDGCAAPVAGAPAAADGTPEPCAVPATVASLPAEVAKAGKTVREYVDAVPDDRADGSPAPAGACDTPAGGDAAAAALAARSPFGRLGALRDGGACATALRGLGQLAGDVADDATAPAYSYVAVGGCSGKTPAPKPADQLRDVLTTITSSPAYTGGGMLIVTTTGATSPCAGSPSSRTRPSDAAPRAASSGATAPSVVFSPWTPPGTTSDTPYDALSVARSSAVALGVDPPNDAAGSSVAAFGEDVLGRAAPGAKTGTATDAAGSTSSDR